MLKRVSLFFVLMLLSLGFSMPVLAAPHHIVQPQSDEASGYGAPDESKAQEPAHEEASGGLPQMDVSRFPGQLFWLAITFILTYVLMKHVALPGVEKTIQTREARISSDIGGSKAKNEAAKHLMVEYEARLAKARSDAQNQTRSVMEENTAKATHALASQTAKVTTDLKAADARILDEKNKAIVALDREVISVVSTLVHTVSGITPTASDVEIALKKVRGA